MNIHKLLFAISFAASSAILCTACSDDDSSTSANEEESSSSVRDSFKSSSSLSTRADIVYDESLELRDTVTLDIEIPKNSTEIDPKSGYLYISDSTQSMKFFLGEFVKGTRVKVNILTSGMSKDTIRIRNEKGGNLSTIDPVWNSEKQDSLFADYMFPGHDGKMLSNSFVVFEEGFYYMELSAKFEKSSRIRTHVQADSAYYTFTGDTTEVSMGLSDTLRGIFTIGQGADIIHVNLSGDEGVSVAFSATGRSIRKFDLFEKDTNLISTSDSTIDALLLPQDSTSWTLKVTPTKVVSYLTGPYATFEVAALSRPLEKGEFFANPDSIIVPGDTLVIERPRNDQAKYYLHQEQYIWLANLEKGDSIDVFHSMEGYCNNQTECPAKCEILDKKRKSVQEVSCLYGGSLKVTSKMTEGPYYFHYARTGDVYPTDESQILTLKAYIQQPGLFKEFNFFDEEADEIYGDTPMRAKLGDTLRFNQFSFRTMPKVASTNVRWFIPCEDIPYIGTKAYISQMSDCNQEQEIFSAYLVVQDSAFGKQPSIIAQSIADPIARDTLKLSINK